MKRVTVTIVLIFISITTLAQTKLGIQALYGIETELGVGAKALFAISDQINASPNINYYFGNSATGVEQSILSFNADAHYIFKNDDITFYPLAGLNLTRNSVTVLGQSVSNSEFGLNLGGGLYYNLSESLTGTLEAKYILGNYDQAVFGAGILFNL